MSSPPNTAPLPTGSPSASSSKRGSKSKKGSKVATSIPDTNDAMPSSPLSSTTSKSGRPSKKSKKKIISLKRNKTCNNGSDLSLDHDSLQRSVLECSFSGAEGACSPRRASKDGDAVSLSADDKTKILFDALKDGHGALQMLKLVASGPPPPSSPRISAEDTKSPRVSPRNETRTDTNRSIADTMKRFGDSLSSTHQSSLTQGISSVGTNLSRVGELIDCVEDMVEQRDATVHLHLTAASSKYPVADFEAARGAYTKVMNKSGATSERGSKSAVSTLHASTVKVAEIVDASVEDVLQAYYRFFDEGRLAVGSAMAELGIPPETPSVSASHSLPRSNSDNNAGLLSPRSSASAAAAAAAASGSTAPAHKKGHTRQVSWGSGSASSINTAPYVPAGGHLTPTSESPELLATTSTPLPIVFDANGEVDPDRSSLSRLSGGGTALKIRRTRRQRPASFCGDDSMNRVFNPTVNEFDSDSDCGNDSPSHQRSKSGGDSASIVGGGEGGKRSRASSSSTSSGVPASSSVDRVRATSSPHVKSMRIVSHSPEVSPLNLDDSSGSTPSPNTSRVLAESFHRIGDFLMKEAEYVGILDCMVSNFARPLTTDIDTMKMLSSSDRSVIFGDIEPIHRFHIDMLNDLRRAVRRWPNIDVATIFWQRVPQLERLYVSYISKKDTAMAALAKARKSSKKFRAFADRTVYIKSNWSDGTSARQESPARRIVSDGASDEVDKTGEPTTLEKLLNAPSVDLLLRYQTFLDLSSQDPDHDDYQAYLNSVYKINEIIKAVMQKGSNKNNLTRMQLVKKKLEDAPADLFQSEDRRLVREGPLVLLAGAASSAKAEQKTEKWVLLFSDMLVVGKKDKKGKVKVTQTIELANCSLEPLDSAPMISAGSADNALQHGFLLYHGSKCYTCAASTADDKLSWMVDIELCLQESHKGQCFGVALQQVVRTEQIVDSTRQLPRVLEACVAFLRPRVETQGMFRVCGNRQCIDTLKEKFDSAFRNGEIADIPEDANTHVVADVLKLWIRKLPTPLVPFSSYDNFVECVDADSEKKKESVNEEIMRHNISQLPDANRLVLIHLIKFIVFVSQSHEQNKMNRYNLAIIFSPSILRRRVSVNPLDEHKTNTAAVELIMSMCESDENMFDQIFALPPLTRRIGGGASSSDIMRGKSSLSLSAAAVAVTEEGDDEAKCAAQPNPVPILQAEASSSTTSKPVTSSATPTSTASTSTSPSTESPPTPAASSSSSVISSPSSPSNPSSDSSSDSPSTSRLPPARERRSSSAGSKDLVGRLMGVT
eukprot:TRINITY_DN629_c0_g2_i1.p1 TRINITY_DN629_c0_g2~~TRINITY_DN629_c0_g2_i1.p1  ORF type:complete len:1288 (+),score=376.29 TRINITY_DN629_c0_g2_i1:362-4225(+)